MDGKIGVLALQGDVSEHIDAFIQAGKDLNFSFSVIPVRTRDDFDGLHALAIPGGESTTMMRLIEKNKINEALNSFSGGIFATCAGMVISAKTLTSETRFSPLGIVDIEVNRNAFGRQRESFEADLYIKGLNDPFHAIFIRAPVVQSAGPDVEILATLPQGIVAVRSGKHMILSFHPEIGGDLRLHHLFLQQIF